MEANTLEIGERVRVKTFLFEGMATIDYITIGELYPIQVELDEADDEGHKLKRIKADEIIKGDVLQELNDQPITGMQLAEIVVNDPGYGLYIGDQYMVDPTKQNAGTHYYFYQLQSLQFAGCMPVAAFKLIGSHDEQIIIQPVMLQPVEPIVLEKSEQMSLFDFM
jgi:hypothetical protein